MFRAFRVKEFAKSKSNQTNLQLPNKTILTTKFSIFATSESNKVHSNCRA